jgi:hypothetical protein
MGSREVTSDAGCPASSHDRSAVYCASCFELYGAPSINLDDRPMPLPPTGHYAICSYGDNDLIFLKFERSFGLSKTLRPKLRLVIGGRPLDSEVAGARAIDYLERIVNEGVSACARRYAQELGRCSRCNRHLTDEASRARGLGPECATR